MRRVIILAGVLALCTFAGKGHADDPAEHRLAREELSRGVAAARADKWEEARSAFERAYALVKSPNILFNLAGAQVKTNQLVEAAESYRVISQSDSVGAAEKKVAKETLPTLEARLAHLRIVVKGGTRPDDTLAIDGKPVSIAAVSADLPANPGTHEVTLSRTNWKTAPASVTLYEGEMHAVTLTPVEVVKVAPSKPASTTTSEKKSSILSSPWLWVGVGVVVVGGSIGAVCLAGGCSSSEPTAREPFRGTLPSVVFR